MSPLCPTTIVQDAPGYNSWSFVQEIPAGIVCCYSRGQEHSITETVRGTYARLSTDGGASWLPETCVANSTTHCECAEGKGLDEEGALLLWVRCADGKEWRHDLYRSRDGRTFERLCALLLSPMPMQITDVKHVPGVGLMSLWFAGQYRDLPENSWGTLVSTDNGRTWKQTTIEGELRRDDWPTEPSFLPLDDGRIFAIARIDNFDGDIPHNCQFQLQSEDGGRSWRKFRTNITDVKLATPSLLLDGESGLVTNYYYHRTKGLLKRRVAPLQALWNHPEAWPEPEIVCTGSTLYANAGNVNACRLRDGRHACTFYSGDSDHQTNIMLAMA